LVSSQSLIDIAGRELVELFVMPKNDHCNVDRAQHRQLVRFLEEAALSFEERYRSVSIVFDGSDFNLSATHFAFNWSMWLRLSRFQTRRAE